MRRPSCLRLALLLLGAALPAAALPAAAQVAPPDAFPGLPAFVQPMDVTAAGDGSNRLYVAERASAP